MADGTKEADARLRLVVAVLGGISAVAGGAHWVVARALLGRVPAEHLDTWQAFSLHGLGAVSAVLERFS